MSRKMSRKVILVVVLLLTTITACTGVSKEEFQNTQATQQAINQQILAALATPTAMPTNTPTPAAPAASEPAPEPYNLPPQPQIGHPSLYLETGTPCKNVPQGQKCTDIDEHTRHWVIALLPGTTAIVGGFKVDGVSNGVYKAQAGPGTLDVTVTDGFIAITKKEWANAEFCFRVSQAVQFNWAHQTVLPLPGWTCP